MSGDKLVYSVLILFIYLSVVSGYCAMVGASDGIFMPEFDRGDVVTVNVSDVGNISELPILEMEGLWSVSDGVLRSVSSSGGRVIFDYDKMSDPEITLNLVNLSGDYRVYLAKSSDFLSNYYIVADWNESGEFMKVWSYKQTKILKRVSVETIITTLNVPAFASRSVGWGFRTADGQSWLDRLTQNMVILEFWLDGDAYGGVYELMFLSGGAPYPGLEVSASGVGVSFMSYVEQMEYTSTADVMSLIPQMLKVLVFNPPEMAMPSFIHWLLFKLPFILFILLFGLIIGGVSPL